MCDDFYGRRNRERALNEIVHWTELSLNFASQQIHFTFHTLCSIYKVQYSNPAFNNLYLLRVSVIATSDVKKSLVALEPQARSLG